jgi:hypothetical protein
MVPFTKPWNADIAQLVEQVIRNDQVVGSNPTIGSNYGYQNVWHLNVRDGNSGDFSRGCADSV